LPSPLPQEREQSAAAVSDDLKAKSSLHLVASNLHGQIRQQPTPSPVGEGWGEGKAVAAQTEFSAAATNPLPSPLPQEREQSAAVVSDSLKAAAVSTESSLPPGKSNLHGQIQQQPAPSPVGEGWGEGKAVAAQSAIAVITESDLYQYVARSRVHNRRKKHAAVSDGLLRDLAEINIGDPVVHEEHGIGRYMGLVTIDLGGETNEMMLLEYAGEAQLYVPVSQLHLISRYSGQAHENIALHKLGSGAWNKAKRKAAEKARDTAAELLNLYAQRAAQSGHKFEINELDYQAFADGFGYEETEDQAAAIAAVIKDLTQAKPMDRLVCGDVGFGKTEVALRAAFVAVMGGKQVAVLAPTTLLVEQHAQNFADRFADFPVKVASLSRFNNSKATKAVLEGMADGTVDIVIGTHKLVQDDIKFKNLGLVIIDEEHRFGVRQKEQLKRLRANVDILTMTATPIPRTLSMALEGLRDFSLITTAPSRRLAVKTFVKPFSEGSVREAVLRELKRGGQVFFLHNEVDTIENMRERLETLLPEARIGVAHGQLRERELEQVMRDFLQQRFNVLLCSTIIETGIDIPNANTIIINRADKFGLAQLHQLRGRVGRSHHQAYAYLLTPEYITKDAEKRLDAIAAADELGAGFTLAMQDLEIRGAGEILGEGQSGEMIQVGFTLYTEMLKQAVRDLKKGRQPDLDAPLGITTEIKLHSPALLPESYCPDIHERLVLYKRLAVCETVQQINAIHEELVDRFGLPEQPVKTLIESHHLRLMAKELGIDAIDAAGEAVTVTFGKNNNVDPTEIILLIQNDKKYRLAGADKLRFTAEMENIEVRINTVKNVLKTLQNRCLPK
ncbi:TPA: transcription-repair coupling factor, partial [Neisseria meningitidis]